MYLPAPFLSSSAFKVINFCLIFVSQLYILKVQAQSKINNGAETMGLYYYWVQQLNDVPIYYYGALRSLWTEQYFAADGVQNA